MFDTSAKNMHAPRLLVPIMLMMHILPLRVDAHCRYSQEWGCHDDYSYGSGLVLIPLMLMLVLFVVICFYAIPEENYPAQVIYYTPSKHSHKVHKDTAKE